MSELDYIDEHLGDEYRTAQSRLEDNIWVDVNYKYTNLKDMTIQEIKDGIDTINHHDSVEIWDEFWFGDEWKVKFENELNRRKLLVELLEHE